MQGTHHYAVVTGAASGIGREIALQLAGQGWRLAISDINSNGLAATAREIEDAGAELLDATPVDISDAEAVDAWAARLSELYGAAHTIHHVGGISIWGRVDTMPLEKWRQLIDVNLMGTVHIIRAFIPAMMQAGPVPRSERKLVGPRRLVGVASVAGIIALPWHAAYSASKGGVLSMLEVLRFDLAPYGIAVHAVAPGAVDTGLVRTIDIDGVDQDNPRVAKARALFQRHAVSPAECAEIILKGVRKNKALITTGGEIAFARWAQVNAPWLYRAAMGGVNRAFRWVAKDAML
ncbi:SDR family oxidoreductase [Corynebacterium sp.]|uniref:SDR family oxidoreductase n=1 Tax=Corynebacterium sp. TaxID=1720 RepID=UPI002A90F553|nr:SDR family oxidoreductase [Corynebacterium sp.]MDY5786064.1 SDR family oxidoreductase [Corynebacterium sp.]